MDNYSYIYLMVKEMDTRSLPHPAIMRRKFGKLKLGKDDRVEKSPVVFYVKRTSGFSMARKA